MKRLKNLAIVAAVGVAAGAVLMLKNRQPLSADMAPRAETNTPGAATDALSSPVARPRLLELGADKCMACKMMTPIIAELRAEYAGRLQVDFIDVWKNESAAEEYNVRIIPQQIFFAADGTELFRHEGFFAKEDILAKWRELGVDLP